MFTSFNIPSPGHVKFFLQIYLFLQFFFNQYMFIYLQLLVCRVSNFFPTVEFTYCGGFHVFYGDEGFVALLIWL